MYILMKTSVGSVKKVRTFQEKSTDVSRKKYGRFFKAFRCFCISLITNHLQMYKKTAKNSSKYRPIHQIYDKPDRYLKRK